MMEFGTLNRNQELAKTSNNEEKKQRGCLPIPIEFGTSEFQMGSSRRRASVRVSQLWRHVQMYSAVYALFVRMTQRTTPLKCFAI